MGATCGGCAGDGTTNMQGADDHRFSQLGDQWDGLRRS